MGASTAGSWLQQRPLAETPPAPSRSATAANPAVDQCRALRPRWNITPPIKRAFSWGNSGAFNLGAATASNLPARSNPWGSSYWRQAASDRACPKPSPLTFLDLATLGQPRLDIFPPDQPGLKTILAPGTIPAVVMPADPLPPRPLRPYSGPLCQCLFRSRIAVVREPGGLVLQLGLSPLNFWRSPPSAADKLQLSAKGRQRWGPSTVVFSPGAEAGPSGLRIDNLHQWPGGCFERN